jgi:hypothetical protein
VGLSFDAKIQLAAGRKDEFAFGVSAPRLIFRRLSNKVEVHRASGYTIDSGT